MFRTRLKKMRDCRYEVRAGSEALLFSNGPASDRAAKMGLYGWLMGDWTMDAV